MNDLLTRLSELRTGDVLTLRSKQYEGFTMRGPVERRPNGELLMGGRMLVWCDGDLTAWVRDEMEIVEVEKSKRIYVNHHREHPVPGDVVRNADDSEDTRTWALWTAEWMAQPDWMSVAEAAMVERNEMPERLLLLINGETGLPVPADV